ncbi:Homeobox protein meis3-B [Fusarium austroafricanum]|uniref:Homeobox protein meis3-B n=1 Tax=Fusarium austroafricanum TaxID=2364996 RepID=A0A8H4KV67_9HYPO|nr:Homeobox protein meis3-B [Fusarium austroafricanum]
MEFSLDDILFTGGDDAALTLPFDDLAPQSRSTSNSLTEGANIEPTPQTINPHDAFSFPASELPGPQIDWNADFQQAKVTSETPADDLNQDFSFLNQPATDWGIPAPLSTTNDPIKTPMTTIDTFFITNGASRPPVPCTNCRRTRLQCLILKTTLANPNPTKSCSSCVALFRECSLAGQKKRKPSAFETSEPVIGRLHGVSEHDILGVPATVDEGQPSQSLSIAALSGKRANTRSVRKTRVLRNWYISNLDHPYPSEEEKVSLSQQSGLSRSQVINWFANTRRRHRLSSTYSASPGRGRQGFAPGSPMPHYLRKNMSPMDRWKNSPPDEEPASATAIQNALAAQSSGQSSLDSDDVCASDGPGSSASNDSLWHSALHDISSNSASSCYSFRSRDATFFSPSGGSSVAEGPSRTTSSRSRTKKFVAFQCTFCRQSFKKKYDWVRHERSIHLPGLDSWICALPVTPDQSFLVWRMSENEAQCLFCGEKSPSDEHIQAHEFDTCAERPVSERKFTRKDHLWQHLIKFHACRKWDGWKPDLSLLQHRQDITRSKCGFCQVMMDSWGERIDHIAAHFRSGLTMEHWVGGSGIYDPGDMDTAR